MAEELEQYNPDEVAARIYHLRQIGFDWQAIQKDFVDQGFGIEMVPTVDSLRATLRSYLTRTASYIGPSDREMILGMELNRLDTLQAAIWPSAITGDPKSIETTLKIMAQRQKITGLDQLATSDKSTMNTVLIVGNDKAAFIEALENGRGMIVTGMDDDDEDDLDGMVP